MGQINVPVKPLQPSLMLANKAGTYWVKYLSGAPHLGGLLALPTNIRLGWKWMTQINA
jgi:hypothetical protein